MKKHLLLKTPIVKDVFLGKYKNQKMSYIQLPANFEDSLLENDIKAGAKIYIPLRGNAKLLDSKYTIIAVQNLEDGYRAVTYLASMLAQKKGYDSDDYICEDLDSGEVDFEEEDLNLFEGIFSDDDDEDCDDFEGGYSENVFRIPIIPADEVVSYDGGGRNFSGFGSFNLEYRRPSRRTHPWWIDCTEESVCILEENDCLPMFGMFDNAELISEGLLKGLKRFENNEHVYLLLVTPQIPEEDFSISRAMLEYSAESVSLTTDQKEQLSYHHLLMQETLRDYSLRLSKKIDSVLLAEKLGSIDPSSPCRTYEKVAKYIVERSSTPTIQPETFAELGLKKLIDRQTDKPIASGFDTLTGMESVKNEFNRFLDSLRYNKMRVNAGLQPLTYHKTMLFVGAPGTAKTTAAKLLTDIMAKEALLPGNRFISISGAQLKGAYVGQTAPKIHALFKEHDAIFIDEAYSLTSSDHGEIDMYAQEALAQLAIELEDHSTDKLVIFAGYGGEKVSQANNKMKQFIDSNPGIKSRISNTVYFDSYTPAEMYDILSHLAEQTHLSFAEDCRPLVEEYFATRTHAADFGNGREARSLLEECQRTLACRLIKEDSEKLDKDVLSTISVEDVQTTLSAIRKMNAHQTGVINRLGYITP